MASRPSPPPREIAFSLAPRLVFALVVVFFLSFGWFALVQERVAFGGGKGRGAMTVEGQAATAFAFVQFTVAAGFAALAVRLAKAPRRTYVLVVTLAFLPPLLFMMWRR